MSKQSTLDNLASEIITKNSQNLEKKMINIKQSI